MTELLLRESNLTGANGTTTPATAGVSGAQRVQIAHGEYADAVLAGRVFALDSDSVTAASTHVTKSALGTIKFVAGFHNPRGSGVNVHILRSVIGTVSGTPGGPYMYNYFPDVGVTSSATGTPRNLLLGSSGASKMKALVNVAIAVDTGATTAAIQLSQVGGPAASAVGAGIHSVTDEVRGAIIVPPGCIFGICVTAAGTTHVLQASLTWEEVRAY